MTETLGSLAQRPRKTGSRRPTYSLEVAGRDLQKLISATATYSVDEANGTSECSVTAETNLERFQNARCVLEVGYGDTLAEWFAGDLHEPRDSHSGEGSEATAWGPYKAMAEQAFLEQVSYVGWDIGDALLDIARRAEMPPGSVEVVKGESFVLSGTDVIFPLETMMDDAASSLIESANFIGVDLPGFRRLYMPTPRMGANERYTASYDEGAYPVGGFSAAPSKRNYYARVVIFRREESGALAFPVVNVPIEASSGRAFKARSNRAYIVPEFKGGEGDAIREAADLAALYARGTWECSLTGISINPDLLPWRTLWTQTEERRDEGGRTKERYSVEYAWQVDREASVEITRESRTMSLSGTGAKLKERKLPKPFYFRVKTSRLVAKPPVLPPPPLGILAGDTEHTIADLAGYTIEELS